MDQQILRTSMVINDRGELFARVQNEGFKILFKEINLNEKMIWLAEKTQKDKKMR